MPTLAIVGDSLTEHWGERRSEELKKLETLAYGISGQFASEIVARIPETLAYRPKYVVILAGTNDIACSEGNFLADSVLETIAKGMRIIRAAGALPILCTIPPVNYFHWRPEVQPHGHIVLLNEGIRALADREQMHLIEFYALLSDERGGIDVSYTNDGAHLTDAAYEKMEELLRNFIAKNVI